jgi:hypothetical protein
MGCALDVFVVDDAVLRSAAHPTSPAAASPPPAMPFAEDSPVLGSPRSRAGSTSLSDLQHESGRGEARSVPLLPDAPERGKRTCRGGADGL